MVLVPNVVQYGYKNTIWKVALLLHDTAVNLYWYCYYGVVLLYEDMELSIELVIRCIRALGFFATENFPKISVASMRMHLMSLCSIEFLYADVVIDDVA